MCVVVPGSGDSYTNTLSDAIEYINGVVKENEELRKNYREAIEGFQKAVDIGDIAMAEFNRLNEMVAILTDLLSLTGEDWQWYWGALWLHIKQDVPLTKKGELITRLIKIDPTFYTVAKVHLKELLTKDDDDIAVLDWDQATLMLEWLGI